MGDLRHLGGCTQKAQFGSNRRNPLKEEQMSTTVNGRTQADIRPAGPEPPPLATTAMGWGNSAPLALAAFAVPTFMLSAVNVGWVNAGVEPMIFAVALMSGGLVQLIAGIIQLRTGNTLAGVLFSMYGALWLSLFAFAEFFAKEVPPAQVGHALGLLLLAFGVFTLWVFVASFRSNAVIVAALAVLAATLFALGIGEYAANTALVHAGGYLGFVAAALAAYLSCAELCEAAYHRVVLPIWPLAKS
jgi:succinate-acetate transporter protein